MSPLELQVAGQAKPTAESIKKQGIEPAATAVKDNANPLADRAVKEGVKPGAKAAAQNAEPLADDLIKKGIEPATQVGAFLVHSSVCPDIGSGLDCAWVTRYRCDAVG